MQVRHGGRGEPQCADELQRIGWRDHKQHEENRQTAGAGAEHVEAVDAVRGFTEARKREAKRERSAEEWHEQQHVDDQKA